MHLIPRWMNLNVKSWLSLKMAWTLQMLAVRLDLWCILVNILGKDPLQGYKNIIQCLNSATEGYTGASFILLENQAGEGSQLGLTMEEMAQVRKLCDSPEKIGFCLDTCHAFASRLWQGSDWFELESKGDN